jgi:hypothetical protein
MGLFDRTPVSKPYVIEFEDGTEVKVDAYDIQEALMAGCMKRSRTNGPGEELPNVAGARPDADKLKQRALDDGLVRRLVGSIQALDEGKDGEDGDEYDEPDMPGPQS